MRTASRCETLHRHARPLRFERNLRRGPRCHRAPSGRDRRRADRRRPRRRGCGPGRGRAGALAPASVREGREDRPNGTGRRSRSRLVRAGPRHLPAPRGARGAERHRRHRRGRRPRRSGLHRPGLLQRARRAFAPHPGRDRASRVCAAPAVRRRSGRGRWPRYQHAEAVDPERTQPRPRGRPRRDVLSARRRTSRRLVRTGANGCGGAARARIARHPRLDALAPANARRRGIRGPGVRCTRARPESRRDERARLARERRHRRRGRRSSRASRRWTRTASRCWDCRWVPKRGFAPRQTACRSPR